MASAGAPCGGRADEAPRNLGNPGPDHFAGEPPYLGAKVRSNEITPSDKLSI